MKQDKIIQLKQEQEQQTLEDCQHFKPKINKQSEKINKMKIEQIYNQNLNKYLDENPSPVILIQDKQNSKPEDYVSVETGSAIGSLERNPGMVNFKSQEFLPQVKPSKS